MSFLARYDSFGAAELARFEAVMTAHLRATRPDEISFAFKNGVNRRYVLMRAAGPDEISARKMRRRARDAAAHVQGASRVDLLHHLKSFVSLLEASLRGEGISVLPAQGFRGLSPRAQALFVVRHHLSASTVSSLRQAWGGNTSGIVSREELRRELAALAQEPERQVWADSRGAHLVSMRCALSGLFVKLRSSGGFVERHVRGADGAPVAHTIQFRPTPELPYELHSDSTAEVHVCVGLDKGGRRTATAKLVLKTPNQKRPMSRGNSIMLSAMPCDGSTNAYQHSMIDPWMGALHNLMDNGILIGGALRALRVFLAGDLAFLSAFMGHQGASARMPCVWCSPVSRPSNENAALVAEDGHLQAAAVPPRHLRTREHLQKMIDAYADEGNDCLPLPMTSAEHLSIERPSCMPWPYTRLLFLSDLGLLAPMGSRRSKRGTGGSTTLSRRALRTLFWVHVYSSSDAQPWGASLRQTCPSTESSTGARQLGRTRPRHLTKSACGPTQTRREPRWRGRRRSSRRW